MLASCMAFITFEIAIAPSNVMFGWIDFNGIQWYCFETFQTQTAAVGINLSKVDILFYSFSFSSQCCTKVCESDTNRFRQHHYDLVTPSPCKPAWSYHRLCYKVERKMAILQAIQH